jgi:hypothetical protein
VKQAAVDYYHFAKEAVISSGYGHEITWQAGAKSDGFTESDLLREAAWVILCSGFREEVVRRHFDFISLCFCDWESADAIVSCGELCIRTAIPAFNNRPKLQSLLDAAQTVCACGFPSLQHQIAADPIEALKRFRHIGPITAYHLAKNLGFPVAKNDRHLQRTASAYGFTDAAELCKHLADVCGDPMSVVDIVLWRFAALFSTSNYRQRSLMRH